MSRCACPVLLALSVLSAVAGESVYKVDPARSELVVRLSKEGVAAAFAHNHVIRATEFSGRAMIYRDSPSGSSVRIEAPTGSLRADEPQVREKYGLSKPLGEDDRERIQETMESSAQLDARRFPTIIFQSTGIEERSRGHFSITGDLTIHGQSRSVTFPVVVEERDGEFRGRGSLKFRQTDFGIAPYRAFFGAVRNRDEATMYIDILLTPVENAAGAAE